MPALMKVLHKKKFELREAPGDCYYCHHPYASLINVSKYGGISSFARPRLGSLEPVARQKAFSQENHSEKGSQVVGTPRRRKSSTIPRAPIGLTEWTITCFGNRSSDTAVMTAAASRPVRSL